MRNPLGVSHTSLLRKRILAGLLEKGLDLDVLLFKQEDIINRLLIDLESLYGCFCDRCRIRLARNQGVDLIYEERVHAKEKQSEHDYLISFDVGYYWLDPSEYCGYIHGFKYTLIIRLNDTTFLSVELGVTVRLLTWDVRRLCSSRFRKLMNL